MRPLTIHPHGVWVCGVLTVWEVLIFSIVSSLLCRPVSLPTPTQSTVCVCVCYNAGRWPATHTHIHTHTHTHTHTRTHTHNTSVFERLGSSSAVICSQLLPALLTAVWVQALKLVTQRDSQSDRLVHQTTSTGKRPGDKKMTSNAGLYFGKEVSK